MIPTTPLHQGCAAILLWFCVLVEQQATRLAATAKIDANAGVAVAGEIRMRLRVPLVGPIALAVGEILEDRRDRVLFGVIGQPDAGRQRRAVLQRDQRMLDNAHRAWKRRHNHRDTPIGACRHFRIFSMRTITMPAMSRLTSRSEIKTANRCYP